MTVDIPRVQCHNCRTRYRVRNIAVLRDRARTACVECGTRFVFVAPSDKSRVGDLGSDAGIQLQPVASVEPQVQSPAPRTMVQRLSFHGVGGSLFGIQIVNVFLTLISLGVYHFWAKVRVRKYVFSQIECGGDRFAYHGTGKELLAGFLRASLIFGAPYVGLAVAHQFIEGPYWLPIVGQSLAAAVFFLFMPVAVIGARRYRCSRTSWRGIRFSFRGKTWDFLKMSVKGSALTALTVGAYYPYYQVTRHGFLVSHTYFGNQRVGFQGLKQGLVNSFALTLFLMPLAIGLPITLMWAASSGVALLLMPFAIGPLWIWFLAKKQRYLWDRTTLGEAAFRSTITARGLLNLQTGNLLLLVVTLGLAWPWITVRNMQYQLSNLTLTGPTDLDKVLQDARATTSTGEGFSNLLDTGFDLD